ncbi:6816_t:CDS:2 [Funneliformis geosporum]|nr:6816_t:CDS:2 [Funneliformis geosporum]
MYNHNNYHKVNKPKANPGGFIAPNSVNPGGFIDPNTNPGGFRVPANSNQYPPVSVPTFPPMIEERRSSMPVKRHSVQVENDSSNIIQSPINVAPYPPYRNDRSYSSQQSLQIIPPVMSATDLQRRFYGTCGACGKPNSDFAECSSCNEWLLHMEQMIKARKALVDQQLCSNCELAKHVHNHMVACSTCGFPKSNLEELNKQLTNYLKCPTFTEIAQRMRKERECLPYDDPNFAKLSKVIKDTNSKSFPSLKQPRRTTQTFTKNEPTLNSLKSNNNNDGMAYVASSYIHSQAKIL